MVKGNNIKKNNFKNNHAKNKKTNFVTIPNNGKWCGRLNISTKRKNDCFFISLFDLLRSKHCEVNEKLFYDALVEKDDTVGKNEYFDTDINSDDIVAIVNNIATTAGIFVTVVTENNLPMRVFGNDNSRKSGKILFKNNHFEAIMNVG